MHIKVINSSYHIFHFILPLVINCTLFQVSISIILNHSFHLLLQEGSPTIPHQHPPRLINLHSQIRRAPSIRMIQQHHLLIPLRQLPSRHHLFTTKPSAHFFTSFGEREVMAGPTAGQKWKVLYADNGRGLVTGHHIVETARGMFPRQQCFCIPRGFPFLHLIDSLSGLSLDTARTTT